MARNQQAIGTSSVKPKHTGSVCPRETTKTSIRVSQDKVQVHQCQAPSSVGISEKSVVFNEHASFYFQWPWYSRCGVCVIRAMCIYSSSPLASFAAGLRVPGSKNAYSRCVRAAREKKSNVQRSTTNIPRTAITNISNNVDWILCQMT